MDPGPRLDAGQLVLGDRTVALTPLESSVLAYLGARSGRAVSRAELLREVWGHESHSDGNLIEAAVSAIRRKLGEDAGLVETVRGVGYRWREP
jgi:DNA-binding response OmpR family regulator